jgi:peptidyl-prolyl cis-trans isomerase D
MIKLMRESAHKYPWLLKSAMGILAIAFVITMGWWGFGERETDAVASVGNLTVFNSATERNTTAGQITQTSTPGRQLQFALRFAF